MDNPLLVGCPDGVRQRHRELEDFFESETIGRDQLRESLSLDQLHRDEMDRALGRWNSSLAAVRFLLLHGVDHDDVRVIQRGDSLGLTFESSETLLIRREVFGQHLDGDIAVERGVPRPIHLTHAALTERFEDLVMSEGFADQDDGSLPAEVRR